MLSTGFAEAIADRIAAEHAALAARWFARLRDLLPVGANEVFPTASLLDHIPSLIVDVSTYLRAPEAEAIAANTLVIEKARELGTLRHQQRASLHQVLREYQLLCAVLLRFVEEEANRLGLKPTPTECMSTVARLHQVVAVMQQETVETFVGLYTRTIADQSERLRQFTRMATHEWRQPLAPIATAVSLLRSPSLNDALRERTLEMVDRNVANLAELTRKLEAMARLEDGDSPTLQEVPVGRVAQEAARQVREMAEARGVRVNIEPDAPRLIIDVGRLELALVNLLSNAIKYSDPSKPQRIVAISARASGTGACHIDVRDNGVGIPEDRIKTIFRRFTRAHADLPAFESVGGVGLGLAIVDDCVSAMNGTIKVESHAGEGTTFTLCLPGQSGGVRPATAPPTPDAGAVTVPFARKKADRRSQPPRH